MQDTPKIPRKINAPHFKFQGGKCRQRKWIVSHFPRNGEVYIEPFAGRGNVFWLACQECKFEHWWINDLKMTPFIQALSDVEVRKLPWRITKADRDWLIEGRAKGDPIALVMEPLWAWAGGSMSGQYTREWSGLNRGREGLNLRVWLNYVQRIKNAKWLLAQYEPNITSLDYTEMPWDVWDETCFAYIDPPYFGANNVRSYEPLDDYGNLIYILSTTRCRWLLSEYDQPEYRKAFGAPISTKVTRAGSAHQRPRRVECVFASANLRGDNTLWS
jgi:hypothetical protein